MIINYTLTESPLISIGIPTFNQSFFLSEAIQSVLNQTYQNFEILIVDDCSTDDTRDIVKNFNDPRIKYIKNEINLRPPKSWNVALKHSRGSYFALLPHDDLWHPNFINEMLAKFQLGNFGFIQCAYLGFNANNIFNNVFKFNQTAIDHNLVGIDGIKWQIDNLVCNPACILFNKEKLLELGGWNENYWDDWAIIVKLTYKHGYYYNAEILSFVRSHINNLNLILKKENREGYHYILDQYYDILNLNTPFNLQLNNTINKYLRVLSYSIIITSIKNLFKKDLNNALKSYKIAISINPIFPFDFIFIFYWVPNKIFSIFYKHKRIKTRTNFINLNNNNINNIFNYD